MLCSARAIAVAGLCLLPAGALAPASASAAASGSITGKVTNAAGAPVAALEVCAYPPSPAPPPGSEPEEAGGPPVACAETHAGGEYAIPGLPAGQYIVEFDGFKCPPGTPPGEFFAPGCSQNYFTQYYNGKSTATEANAVSVAEGKPTEGINATMAEPGRIAGRVTSAATGAPIPGAMVCAIAPVSEGFGCAETGPGGEYVISGLAGGEYKVQFADRTCSPEGCSANYVTQYYNEKRVPASADAVPVTLGKTTEGINARLAPGGRISGKVTDATSGAPIKGVFVCAVEVSGATPTGAGDCAQSQSNGEYAVSGLGSGQYKVVFQDITCSLAAGTPTCTEVYETQWYNDKPSLAAADTVSVTEPGTTGGIDARLVPAPPGTPTDATGIPGSLTRGQSPLALGEAVARAHVAVRRHRALVHIRCVGHGECKGTLKLLARVGHAPKLVRLLVVGSARFTIAAGHSATIGVRLTRRGRALLRRAGRRGLKLELAGTGVQSRTVLLR